MCYKILEFIFVLAINLHLFIYSIRMVAIYSLVTSQWSRELPSFTSIPVYFCIFKFQTYERDMSKKMYYINKKLFDMHSFK